MNKLDGIESIQIKPVHCTDCKYYWERPHFYPLTMPMPGIDNRFELDQCRAPGNLYHKSKYDGKHTYMHGHPADINSNNNCFWWKPKFWKWVGMKIRAVVG